MCGSKRSQNLKTIVKADKENEAALTALGLLLAQHGHTARAEQIFARLAAISPENSNAQQWRDALQPAATRSKEQSPLTRFSVNQPRVRLQSCVFRHLGGALLLLAVHLRDFLIHFTGLAEMTNLVQKVSLAHQQIRRQLFNLELVD